MVEDVPQSGIVIPLQPNASDSGGVPVQGELKSLSPPCSAVYIMMNNFCFDSTPECIRTGRDQASNYLNMDKDMSYFPVAIFISHAAVATSFIPLTLQLQKLSVCFKSKYKERRRKS